MGKLWRMHVCYWRDTGAPAVLGPAVGILFTIIWDTHIFIGGGNEVYTIKNRRYYMLVTGHYFGLPFSIVRTVAVRCCCGSRMDNTRLYDAD